MSPGSARRIVVSGLRLPSSKTAWKPFRAAECGRIAVAREQGPPAQSSMRPVGVPKWTQRVSCAGGLHGA